MIRALALLLVLALPSAAQEVIVAGMSQNRVSITADFDGSEILIYGAVKRDSPAPEGGPLEVIAPPAIGETRRLAGIPMLCRLRARHIVRPQRSPSASTSCQTRRAP